MVLPGFEDRTGLHLGCACGKFYFRSAVLAPLASQYCPVAVQTELETHRYQEVVAIPYNYICII